MLDEVYSKITRADKHILELEDVLTRFEEDEPHTLASKHDHLTGEYVVYLASVKPLPEQIPLIVGDVIHNLYNALDYLAWQLVLAAGKETPGPSTAFPISERVPTTRDELQRYERQVKGMTDEVKTLIAGLSPYRGANNCLWRLHKLNNIDKHRNLLTVFRNTHQAAGWGGAIDNMQLSPEPLDEGSEVARFPPGRNSHQDVIFMFDVALNEREADTRMWPLASVLHVFHNTVLATVAQFDKHRYCGQS